MKVVHTIKDLQAELSALRAQGKKVGLVPTMGALHAGHASLVKRSVSENGVTVVRNIRVHWMQIAVCWKNAGRISLFLLQLAKCIRNRIPVNLAMHHWIR